jgi:amino acid transporter
MNFKGNIWAEADIHRDGGLPASKFFARVHPTLQLPLNALILTVVVVICFGCIFLGSSR